MAKDGHKVTEGRAGGGPGGNIVLVGFMGAGKSEVGRRLARRLRRFFVDTDDVVTARAQKSIPDIFRAEQEAGFRRRERAAVVQAAALTNSVIATGGGVVADEASWNALAQNGVTVWLRAPLDVLVDRAEGLHGDEGPEGRVERPLLAQGRDAVEALYRSREDLYARAHISVDTEGKHPDAVVDEICARLRDKGALVRAGDGEAANGHQEPVDATLQTVTVDLGERSYPIWIGNGFLPRIGQLLKNIGVGSRILVVTQPALEKLYGAMVMDSLDAAGIHAHMAVIPGGEEHKTLDTVRGLYRAALQAGLDRGSAIVALGGGVVGDVAGMAAATYMRGIDFVQVPTTLLAQVDAAVGGKVGVNLPEGKNLVGAFHQPRAVAADTATLLTLPDRELGAGLAEVVKYGLIADADFFRYLEERADALVNRGWQELAHVIRRSCEIKAYIVAQDEREADVRALLNFGHTFGHGLEAATEYSRFLHGEAVGIGMVAALRLSQRLGMVGEEAVVRGEALLQRLGLPVAAGPVNMDAVWEAMGRDKKVLDGRLRVVLLDAVGQATVVDDVPEADVRAALASVCR